MQNSLQQKKRTGSQETVLTLRPRESMEDEGEVLGRTRAGGSAPKLHSWESHQGHRQRTLGGSGGAAVGVGGRRKQVETKTGVTNTDQSFKCLIPKKNEVTVLEVPSTTGTGDVRGMRPVSPFTEPDASRSRVMC